VTTEILDWGVDQLWSNPMLVPVRSGPVTIGPHTHQSFTALITQSTAQPGLALSLYEIRVTVPDVPQLVVNCFAHDANGEIIEGNTVLHEELVEIGSAIAGCCVNSIADLRALNAGAVPCLSVLGYHGPDDGGGGDFYWDASATETDNGGTIIVLASNPVTGRWKRLVDGPLSVKWFGASGDGQLVNDGAINIGVDDQLLTSASGLFTTASVGKYILVSGAGPSGGDLETTIASYVSSTQIRLAADAATTVTTARVLWGTDDGTAIGLTIAALGTANNTAQVNARVLAFPKGLYLTSVQLPTTNRTNVIVQGEGQAFAQGFKLPTTGIIYTGTLSPFVLLSGNYSRGWQFRDLGLMYAKSSFTGTVADVEVAGVRFIEVLFGGLGFTTSSADLYTAQNNLIIGPSEHLICERCQFMNAKRHVYLTGQGIGPTSIDRCVFYSATQRFIEFSEAGNFTFSLTRSMFDPVNFGQIPNDGLIINTNGYYIAGNFFGGALSLAPSGSYLRLSGTGTVQGNTFRTNYTGIIAVGSADISGNIFFAPSHGLRYTFQIRAAQNMVIQTPREIRFCKIK
jgi:hypothetical protein